MTEQARAKTDYSAILSRIAKRAKEARPDILLADPEKREKLVELCGLYGSNNRIAYEARRNELKDYFNCSAGAIDATVKLLVKQSQGDADPGDDDLIVQELIAIAKREADLWQNEYRVGFATFRRDQHIENHEVEKADFKYFIRDRYGEIYQREINGKLEPIWPPRRCLTEAIYHLKGYAQHGEEKDPKVRVTEYQGELWIDLGNRVWQAVRVSAQGWKIKDRMEAPLVRGSGMRPLPLPVAGGNIHDLRQFANVRNDADFVLLCGMTATILSRFGNYLTEILCGPPGSGKTTVTRVQRALSDPHKTDTRRYTTVRDLMHGAGNTHVIALENVSSIKDDLSDTICSLNTGTGYAERKYYAQGEEFSERHHNPVVINGIPNNLADRTDLIDRTVTFVFDYLGDQVRSEAVFWQRFNAAAPRLFGALLDGLVRAMKVREQFHGDVDEAAEVLLEGYRPRFVDAVVWAEAACQGMGFEPGEFTQVYRDNQIVALRYIGENNTICVGIRKLIAQQGSWQGIPSELRVAIKPYLKAGDVVPNEVWISRSLPWIIPILDKLYGIEVTMNVRLNQNVKNGIIITGSKGRYFEEQIQVAIPTPKATTSTGTFRRRI
jgi:hypothetical protein